jgi:AraC family transcriptional regulator
MDTTIIEKPEMVLVGLAIDVTLKQVLHVDRPTYYLASTFMKRKDEIGSCKNDREVFGLSTDPDNYNPDRDAFEYFIGVEVSSLEHIPDGMVYRRVPANKYVVFSFKGPADKAGTVHAYLYSTWLHENEYELCAPYNIEIYGDKFIGPESEESVTDIIFPIRNKG